MTAVASHAGCYLNRPQDVSFHRSLSQTGTHSHVHIRPPDSSWQRVQSFFPRSSGSAIWHSRKYNYLLHEQPCCLLEARLLCTDCLPTIQELPAFQVEKITVLVIPDRWIDHLLVKAMLLLGKLRCTMD